MKHTTNSLVSMKRHGVNEETLVARIIAGEEKSLRLFYHMFYRSLRTYIGKKIANEQDAEEVLQDTLLASLEALRNFSFRSSLFTFLCSIANHKVIDFYRKKKIRHLVFSACSDIEPLISTLFGPEEALDEELLRRSIREAFGRITPIYQTMLTLKYVHGYSVGEIAQKLSISFKSAESKLFRARRAFVLAYQTAV